MSKKKVVLVIQARMNSSRFPNKSMSDLCGAPLIERIIQRDNLLESEIIKRMEHQWSDKKKANLSDHIINNDNWKDTLLQFDNLFKKLNLYY